MRGRGVLDPDEWIAATPDDQGRDHLCQVEPVGRAHALPGEVDHRAVRVQERTTRFGVAQGGVAANHLGQVVPELQPEASEHLPERFAHHVHARVGDERQHEFGAWQRGGPQQRVNLWAQAPAVDEHELWGPNVACFYGL